jgi:hypothetical protein
VEILKYTPKGADMVLDVVLWRLSVNPKTSRKGVASVRNFLVEYKLVDENKTPAVDELFTNRFID